MESPEDGLARRRNGASAAPNSSRRTYNWHHSASNVSSSSTSSDILVAPGPTTSRQTSQTHQDDFPPTGPDTMARRSQTSAYVHNGRHLLIRIKGRENVDAFKALMLQQFRKPTPEELRNALKNQPALDSLLGYGDDGNNDGNSDGPNRRGTYPKEYTLKHPEIDWVHRGQGRYLPASQAPPSASTTKVSQGPIGVKTHKSIDKGRPIPQTRKTYNFAKLINHSNEQDAASFERIFDPDDPASYSHRKRRADAQTTPTTTEARSARLARTAKPTLIIDERRSSRISTRQNYNEDEEDSDMGGDKELTFDRAFVDAHPELKFYHTGNGWYKSGSRPKVRNYAKRRESEGHASVRRGDGSWQFEGKTIHVSQLDNYRGVEFHHCGNGWYRPGPDSTGHRISRIVGESDGEDEYDEDNDGGDEAEYQDEMIDEDAVVSKVYAQRHPEVDWVHRGNGRYKRRSVVESLAAPSEAKPEERDQTIYSKAYMEAHPDEEFHHRGNARYMRGPPPDHWASVRRRKSQNATLAQAAQEDDSVLFSKAFVDSHPNEVFHHRGQGRWARGARPKTAVSPEDVEDSDADLDGLVDTDYVESHPQETFHHRGQGRWARGLPPAGTSNKVAIRGPGASQKAEDASPLEEEDETNKLPALTALVVKADGPDKWPTLQWHYRGGGKWGRVTKLEFEEMQRAVTTRKPKGKGKMRSMDGPEAQLEREAAAAEAAQGGDFDDAFQMPAEVDMNGVPARGRGRIKRRRVANRGSLQTTDDVAATKQASKPQSQAPTPKPPKPRMLEPEEDILTSEDLPSLYRESWSPDSDNTNDEAERLLRATYKPLNSPEKFVKGLAKHDPQVRSLDNLLKLAAHGAEALKQIQKEYLELEKITAPHARIPRKQAKGGRVPVDEQVFEDKKEADLYDYTYDARKLGHQDPDVQKIQRDAEGRELRGRRGRSGAVVQPNGILPGWTFGEEELLGPRRVVKPVNRFDGVVDAPRKRAPRGSAAAAGTSKAASLTPDRSAAATPLGGSLNALPKGNQTGLNVPKRIRELRGENTGAGSLTREGSPARKGRPPGSKNLHKRRDAGIKKGPRKPKVVDSIETEEEV